MSNDQATQDYEEKAPYTKLVTKVKRGSGTRDQDTTKVVTRHPDPDVAVLNHKRAIAALKDTAEAARRIQPEDDDE